MAKKSGTALRKLARLIDDPWLDPYRGAISARAKRVAEKERELTKDGAVSLADFAAGHEYFGLKRGSDEWIFREWAPNATAIFLVGTFSEWEERGEFALSRLEAPGQWEIRIPLDKIRHGDLFKLKVYWDGGSGERIPAYARRVVQDDATKLFCAQVWAPEHHYEWSNSRVAVANPVIYEAHVGMASEEPKVASFREFRENVLPRVVDGGYNTLQLMAVMEHPYYGSFGYHVSSFFAVSSRFGTPEELKELVDEAHGAGLAVIIDLVHSHAVKNEVEGISRFDGTDHQYFHSGPKGEHEAWDSRCFDYGKNEVVHFLLSNCRFWLDEYKIDGFRFDGVTSMLYFDHGLGPGFNSYDDYFNPARVDEDAAAYLGLANKLVHEVAPTAMTIAEDVSGMPGLGAPVEDGGLGFDFKLAMGIPDFWFKTIKTVRDEDWSVDEIWRELTNRRADEKSISYVESHDQAIVGGKSLIFELMDAEMYHAMSAEASNPVVDRGIALHKMIRLVTFATAGDGYLTFIGNEFGHPEWVDFPREGNDWSYKYARRQWSLRDNPDLKYHFLADFEKEFVLAGNAHEIFQYRPDLRFSHYEDHILACQRGALVFIFNFHPSKSVSDYFIDMPEGTYRHVFDSDEKRFGGFDRIAPGQKFTASADGDGRAGIKTYLPCRTAMVLAKVRSE